LNKIFLLLGLTIVASIAVNAMDLQAGINYKNTKECVKTVNWLNVHQGDESRIADSVFDKYLDKCEIKQSDLNLDDKIETECYSLTGAWIGQDSEFCYSFRPDWIK